MTKKYETCEKQSSVIGRGAVKVYVGEILPSLQAILACKADILQPETKVVSCDKVRNMLHHMKDG